MGDTKIETNVLLDFCNPINDNAIDSLEEDSNLVNGELHTEAMKEELQVAPVSEKLLLDSDTTNPGPSYRHHKPFLFCAKELSTSIMTSESTRIICSLFIALVVVLSFIDRPLIGIDIVHSKSIVAMRPLYMLLVTEFTILFAYLVLERRRRIEDSEELPRVFSCGELSWERAVRVLERGLVAHQMIRAIFIDFSVYVVIVVCVLSLV